MWVKCGLLAFEGPSLLGMMSLDSGGQLHPKIIITPSAIQQEKASPVVSSEVAVQTQVGGEPFNPLIIFTGSLNLKCDKVKAKIINKYLLKIFKQGASTCTACGHLWKYKANLSKLNGSEDMIHFLQHVQLYLV